MGKLVERDYLWLRDIRPQKSPTWRRWAPLGLIPAAAVLAWVATAPNAPQPDRTNTPDRVTTASASRPPARALPANFVAPKPGTPAPKPAGLQELAFSPAQRLTASPGEPGWQQVVIQDGDTLSLAFARHGLSYMDSLRIAHLPKLGRYFTRGLKAGDVLKVKADQSGRIEQLQYDVDPLHHLTVRRGEHGLTGALAEQRAEHRRSYASGVIHSSFYRDAMKAGLTDRQVTAIHHIFSRNVNFDRDIQSGDRFMVVYDELYHDDKKMGNGPILAAALINNGRVIRALRDTDRDGHSEYYRPDGRPLRQAFVRSPVHYTHISSPFNLNRKHPILHRIRRHEGTDYAAASGTPIHATGDGTITFRGRRGGYGNVVIIRHDRDISMRFAHMSRFARNLHVGSRVKQGQVIGYVGMTGLATGPHLHYEFRVDGKPRNPQTVSLPGAPPLQGRELVAFKSRHADLLARLDDMTGAGKLRMASAADSP
ncbi:peptidoglycan DD-metalloendopeptidase family protein [Salinisphaera sp. SPP-AMP-43]|uniref:peptidoglycan DD-metalloendopeptidase family protein n=1 Tax=Salinisphaera sp. SPP-AMP-43 TaxID=3121288 RepID=UPI003C6DEDB4